MSGRRFTLWVVGLWAALGFLGSGVAAEKGRGAPDSAAKLFQTKTVWNVQWTFTPEQWAAMEPAAPARRP